MPCNRRVIFVLSSFRHVLNHTSTVNADVWITYCNSRSAKMTRPRNKRWKNKSQRNHSNDRSGLNNDLGHSSRSGPSREHPSGPPNNSPQTKSPGYNYRTTRGRPYGPANNSPQNRSLGYYRSTRGHSSGSVNNSPHKRTLRYNDYDRTCDNGNRLRGRRQQGYRNNSPRKRKQWEQGSQNHAGTSSTRGQSSSAEPTCGNSDDVLGILTNMLQSLNIFT